MNTKEQKRFDTLYKKHLRALKIHGYSASTIDVYSRTVRRISGHFDCVPDKLTVDHLSDYFSKLIDSHSWGTVRVDRNGLQFFWQYILKLDWQWVEMVKPPVGPEYSCNPRKIDMVQAVDSWVFNNFAGLCCSDETTVRRVAIQGLVCSPRMVVIQIRRH